MSNNTVRLSLLLYIYIIHAKCKQYEHCYIVHVCVFSVNTNADGCIQLTRRLLQSVTGTGVHFFNTTFIIYFDVLSTIFLAKMFLVCFRKRC